MTVMFGIIILLLAILSFMDVLCGFVFVLLHRDVTWPARLGLVSQYTVLREQSTDRVQIQLDGVAENFRRVLARPSSRSDPRGER